MNIGGELERARKSCGLSLEQVSARTKVSLERLIAIEHGDVEQLPPLVYLRGFLRSYASEVGLDPDEVTKRYVAQLEDQSALDEFESEAPAHRADDWAGSVHAPDIGEESVEQAGSSERPLEPTDQLQGSVQSAGTAAPLWHRAQFLPDQLRHHVKAETEPAVRQVNPELESIDRMREAGAHEHEPVPGSAAPDAMKSRLPLSALAVAAVIAVVAGYFLSVNLDKLRGAVPGVSQIAPPSAADEASVEKSSDEVAPAASSASDTAKGGELASARDAARADVRDGPAVAADTGKASGVEDVSGSWTLTNRVESASYKPFTNLTLVYRLQLQQRGNRVSGGGHKWTENGRTIPPRGRTPISLEGTLNGQRLELKFTERGARRTSGGTLVMDVTDAGSLRGSFVSDAARSRGSSQATRVP